MTAIFSAIVALFSFMSAERTLVMSCFASVVIRACSFAAAGSLTHMADGHCSAVFSQPGILLCDRGRICGTRIAHANHFVDAITGEVSSRAAVCNPVVDTSGALLWRDDDGALLASSGACSDGHALPDVESLGFRYGMCVIRSGDGDYRVLRFDCEPTLNVELDRE